MIKYGVLFTCLIACNAWAEIDCIEHETQSDINVCLIKQEKEHSAALDEIYQVLHDKSRIIDQKHLGEAREAWEIFVKQQCAYNNIATEGGSIHSMALSLCRIELTKQYIELLNTQLNCEEGDLSCTRR